MTTIDKFSYHLIKVPIHKRDHNYNIHILKLTMQQNKNIKHPVIREILKIYKINKIDIHHDLTFLVKVAWNKFSFWCGFT